MKVAPIDHRMFAENAELRAKLAEAEDTLRAIRSGDLDALVVESEAGPRVYTLQSAEAASNRARGDLLDLVGDAVVALDHDQRLSYLNPAAELLFSLNASAVLGRPASELHGLYWLHGLVGTIDPGPDRAWRGETTHVGPDGHQRVLEATVTWPRQAHDAAAGVIAAFRDITERRRAQAEADAQARRQSLLLDVTAALIGSNLDERELGRIVFERIATSLGADICFNYRLDRQSHELTLVFESGIPPALRLKADRLHLNQAFCGTVAASCRPINADAARVAGDPKGAFVHGMGVKAYACHPLRAGDGRVLGTFSLASTTRTSFTAEEVAFLQTVSNVLAQAWERIGAEQVVREQEALLRTVTDNASVGLVLLDRERRYTFANRTYCRILELPDDIVGERPAELLAAVYADQISPNLDRAFAGERVAYELTRPAKGSTEGASHYSVIYDPQRDREGAVTGVTVIIFEITERKRAEIALRESEQRLTLALRASATGVWDWNLTTDRVSWTGEIYSVFGVESFGGTRAAFAKFVHPGDAERLSIAVKAALKTGSLDVEFRIIRADGQERWVDNQAVVIRDASGKSVRLLGTVHDITERKRAVEHINLLMNEVNHRSKNLLGLVQAVARQTFASDPKSFIQRFGERVQSISASQDLLVKSQWRGIETEDLVRSQIAHFADLIGTRVILKGPQLRVSSAAAQSIGMALHELATNAGNYGALSSERGRVEIAWSLAGAGAGDDRRFIMSWIERDGPPVLSPTRRGFGTTVIEAMVRSGLNGDVKLDYAASGVCWQLDCPAARALEKGETGENILRRGAESSR